MSSQTLYEIHADLSALEDLLLAAGGDVSDAEVEEAVDAWLAETGEAVKDKLDRYAALIREMEGRAESRKAEAERLSQLAAADVSAARRLKDRLLWFMREHEMPKVETPRFRLAVQANGGKTPVVLHVAPEALPVAWRTEVVTYRAETDAIRAALEAGTTLEFAELAPRGFHLRVR